MTASGAGVQQASASPTYYSHSDALTETGMGGARCRSHTQDVVGRLLYLFLFFLRSEEATVPIQTSFDPSVHLSITDVMLGSQTTPKVIMIRIKASKTDLFREGTTIPLVRTDSDLCPVAPLFSYVATRSLNSGPLFIFPDGSPLTRQSLIREICIAPELISLHIQDSFPHRSCNHPG